MGLLTISILTSCTKSADSISGTGTLKIEFEHGFAGNELVLGAANTPNSLGETLKISAVTYIISNIVLIKDDGSTFVYPKSSSYFIIDAAAQTGNPTISMPNIPAGNYKAIQFGIGVDQAQYELGASGQGNLWTQAQNSGMTWSWAAGYKFLKFEGTFTSSSVTNDTSFMIHTGKTGTDYNYTSVQLALPTQALVRTNISPQIHLSVDLAQITDGTHKISLTDANSMGMGAMIMGGSQLPLITANLPAMFAVEHVHNN